ncbi:hypothetical protein [Thalassotalea euphylliae]|uniref:Uncharacterized protein n=1 Tax=Thalassotalea euphylliae TaxID=1655234 RepID=A0A3E0UIG4_9GAMM|nr:hypothetical protein [Thalassotalea euphylliae]REL36394.1 hypothetical protein DXX92_14350 [Thalassotalea euphylliae]
MSPHDKSDQFEDKQFENWLDKQLSPEQAAEFENNHAHESAMKQHIATAKYVEYLASQEAPKKVPNWDRTAVMDMDNQHTSHKWWQWSGLPVLSMAFSCFAMALVLFNVQFTVSDQGMLLTFGKSEVDPEVIENQVTERVNKLVDDKLNQYQQSQQLALANFTNELSDKQQQSNLQLASYILETSRQERKEDISDFIQFVNAQRNDDALDQRIRFQQLEDALLQQSTFINQTTTMQPANWAN